MHTRTHLGLGILTVYMGIYMGLGSKGNFIRSTKMSESCSPILKRSNCSLLFVPAPAQPVAVQMAQAQGELLTPRLTQAVSALI